jgi:hypothetical protein
MAVLAPLGEDLGTLSAMNEIEPINRTTGAQRARISSVSPDLVLAPKPCRCHDSHEQVFGPGCALFWNFRQWSLSLTYDNC